MVYPRHAGFDQCCHGTAGIENENVVKEGFGVVGGAGGTYFGTLAGLGVIAIFGLGPFGAFVAVFICASLLGWLGMEGFKRFGGGMYDYGFQFDDSQIYHSPEQFLIGIQ